MTPATTCGRLPMDRVPSFRDDREPDIGQAPGHLLGNCAEFFVALSDDELDRDAEPPQPRPQRWQHAGPEPSERRRQAGGAVASAILVDSCADPWRLVGKYGSPRPTLHKLLDRRSLELVGEPLIRGPTLSSGGCIAESRTGTDQHQSLHAIVQHECCMQRNPPAHRVAGKRERAGEELSDVADHGVKCHRSHPGSRAVTAKVRRQRLVPGHRCDDIVPAAAGVGETVEKHDGRRHVQTSCPLPQSRCPDPEYRRPDTAA